MADDEDELVFAEDEDSDAASDSERPWRLLIVDDEEEIHSVTRLALGSFRLQGRGLEFLHAYSGAQAREMLRAEPDIGLVLLDVIMETDDAGLQVARFIREELNNHFIRIILRTGQPGQAPERRVITEYDINDYKEKTELTAAKLYSVVYTGLSSYDDMRQLELARADLQRRNEEIQRAYEDLEKFSYMASHDLQAPLRTIHVFMECLQERIGDTLDPESADLLQRVSAAAQRLRGLISSLLELARVDTCDLQLSHVELGEVVDSIRESVTATLQKSGGRIDYDPAGLPRLTTEPTLIHLLLQNLVGNGLKYQPADRAPVVSVQARQEGDEWQISVADNGIGIEPKYLGRIFEEFERLHTRSEYEGSGIGLAICKRIVRRLNGRIWVESEPGKGSRFTVALPVAPATA